MVCFLRALTVRHCYIHFKSLLCVELLLLCQQSADEVTGVCVNMHVCASVCVHACMSLPSIYKCKWICVSFGVCVCVFLNSCVCKWCLYSCLHLYSHKHMYVSGLLCMCSCHRPSMVSVQSVNTLWRSIIGFRPVKANHVFLSALY